MKRRFQAQIAAGYGIFRRRRLGEAWVLGASIALPLAVAGVAGSMALRYSWLGGWIGPLFVLSGLAAALWVALRFGWRHHLSQPEFVRQLERRLGLKENDLVNALEMEEKAEKLADPLTRGLAELSVEQGRKALTPVVFGRLAPALAVRVPLLRIAGSVAVLVVLGLAAPGPFASALHRLGHPGQRDLPPALVIQVDPGNLVVERGTSVRIAARLARTSEAMPLLLSRAPGGAWKRVAMAPDSIDGVPSGLAFQGTLPSVLEATDYLVAAGHAESETYRVRVIEPLRATGYQKRIEFPAYTALAPTQELGVDGNLSALVGSRATLVVYPSRPGARGRLLIEGEEPRALEAVGREELAVTMPVRRALDFRVELSSEETAGSSWQSDRFHLEAVADRMPVLFQLAPERNIVLPPEMAVTLELDCMDDFGLSRLDLVSRRNDDPEQRTRLAAWQGNREARVSWPWELGELGLVPGDRIRYHLELTDNDAVTGPKTAISPEGEIRLPSFEEMYASLDEDRRDQVASAEESLERQKDVADDLKRTLQEMKQNKNFRWEDQERVKDLAERQEKVAASVQELAEAMERSLERMEQSAVFSPEVLEKVQQINQLVQEIQSPEFREQMKKLQQAIEQLDRSAVQKAMQNLQLTQEQLVQNLDRTLEMLKQLQREETLDHLIEQAENLLNQQKQLNDEVGGTPPDSTRPEERETAEQAANPGDRPPEPRDGERQDSRGGESPSDSSGAPPELSPEEAAQLKERQDALREELRKLQEQIDQLRQEASKSWEKLAQEMEQRKSEQSLSSASQEMQKAAQSMQQQQRKKGLTFGRQAQQDLEQFAQGMRQAQAAMNGAEQEEVARRLYALSGNLVRLSQEQEELLRAAPARSTRDLAREQQRLAEGARKTLDELFELAKQSRFVTAPLARAMGEAVRTLDTARETWVDGNRPGGMQEGRAAGQAIDATVLSLLNAGQSMCKGGSASSCSNPLQRMRSLSGQQESLNQETQQMMGQCSGGQRLSPSGSDGERLMQAAARQEMIRQGLSELQQSMQSEQGLMGRIGDIGQEMAEVVEEMRHRGLDERVVRRQERILSRLLTAQRSLRQEGQKEERVSRPGENPADRESPAAYVPGPNDAEALQRGILRGSQDPVPGDFRRVVEAYFRSLGGAR